jgi:hypothetical protein
MRTKKILYSVFNGSQLETKSVDKLGETETIA